MDKLMEDLLDPKPLPGVTTYAAGTALQGVAVGVLIAYFLPSEPQWLRWGVAGAAYLIGAPLTVWAFSRLKRRYRIVPLDQADSSNLPPA